LNKNNHRAEILRYLETYPELTECRIINFLKDNPGSTARIIAFYVRETIHHVTMMLSRLEKFDICYRVKYSKRNIRWFLHSNFIIEWGAMMKNRSDIYPVGLLNDESPPLEPPLRAQGDPSREVEGGECK
jgi:hypothetical protein